MRCPGDRTIVTIVVRDTPGVDLGDTGQYRSLGQAPWAVAEAQLARRIRSYKPIALRDRFHLELGIDDG